MPQSRPKDAQKLTAGWLVPSQRVEGLKGQVPWPPSGMEAECDKQ